MARMVTETTEVVFTTQSYEVDEAQFKKDTGVPLGSATEVEIIEYLQGMKTILEHRASTTSRSRTKLLSRGRA